MPELNMSRLEGYLSSLYKENVRISSIRLIGKETGKKGDTDLKGFGYGIPYIISFSVNNKINTVVLESMSPNSFGHDHFSDRAQSLIWDHSTFNKLQGHVKSLDVGAFTVDGRVISVGDGEEFFIVTEFIEGNEYYKDLERILAEKDIKQEDEDRVTALAEYLAAIHKVKIDAPQLYTRRIRDLVGHGECIMGLIDNYRTGFDFITRDLLKNIELNCVEWRWRIKDMGHRLSQVHGDFHPWNIIFREGADFTVLDRARGEWGEPADDAGTIAINYLFFSLQCYGRLEGAFERLYSLFWERYLRCSCDKEIFKVIQPFLAWRGLVLGNPLWYPALPCDVRKKIFNFIKNVLMTDEFEPARANEYLEDR